MNTCQDDAVAHDAKDDEKGVEERLQMKRKLCFWAKVVLWTEEFEQLWWTWTNSTVRTRGTQRLTVWLFNKCPHSTATHGCDVPEGLVLPPTDRSFEGRHGLAGWAALSNIAIKVPSLEGTICQCDTSSSKLLKWGQYFTVGSLSVGTALHAELRTSIAGYTRAQHVSMLYKGQHPTTCTKNPHIWPEALLYIERNW